MKEGDKLEKGDKVQCFGGPVGKVIETDDSGVDPRFSPGSLVLVEWPDGLREWLRRAVLNREAPDLASHGL